MKKENKIIFYLFLRYLLLVVLAINGFWLIYSIFTPLTIYPVYFLLNILFHASLSGASITFNNALIQLIPACIAGSAYYLLLILNLTTPMPVKTRIYSLIFSLFSFLIINILRIFLFSLLLISSFSLFNILHLIFWYFLSSLLVFAVWLVTIKLFKVENIPIYSDIKFLFSKIR